MGSQRKPVTVKAPCKNHYTENGTNHLCSFADFWLLSGWILYWNHNLLHQTEEKNYFNE